MSIALLACSVDRHCPHSHTCRLLYWLALCTDTALIIIHVDCSIGLLYGQTLPSFSYMSIVLLACSVDRHCPHSHTCRLLYWLALWTDTALILIHVDCFIGLLCGQTLPSFSYMSIVYWLALWTDTALILIHVDCSIGLLCGQTLPSFSYMSIALLACSVDRHCPHSHTCRLLYWLALWTDTALILIHVDCFIGLLCGQTLPSFSYMSIALLACSVDRHCLHSHTCRLFYCLALWTDTALILIHVDCSIGLLCGQTMPSFSYMSIVLLACSVDRHCPHSHTCRLFYWLALWTDTALILIHVDCSIGLLCGQTLPSFSYMSIVLLASSVDRHCLHSHTCRLLYWLAMWTDTALILIHVDCFIGLLCGQTLPSFSYMSIVLLSCSVDRHCPHSHSCRLLYWLALWTDNALILIYVDCFIGLLCGQTLPSFSYMSIVLLACSVDRHCPHSHTCRLLYWLALWTDTALILIHVDCSIGLLCGQTLASFSYMSIVLLACSVDRHCPHSHTSRLLYWLALWTDTGLILIHVDCSIGLLCGQTLPSFSYMSIALLASSVDRHCPHSHTCRLLYWLALWTDTALILIHVDCFIGLFCGQTVPSFSYMSIVLLACSVDRHCPHSHTCRLLYWLALWTDTALILIHVDCSIG